MELKRLFDLLAFQQEKFHKKDCIASKYNGEWKTWSTTDIINQSDSIALGLIDLGIAKGDMIGLSSDSSPEWVLLDFAVQKMGGVLVPIYPTSAEKDIEFICNHAEIKVVFTHGQELHERFFGLRDKMPSVKHFFTTRDVKGVKKYTELLKQVTPEGLAKLKEIQSVVDPEDMATIIYTSGTTGDPKGVMLSHKNIMTNLMQARDVLPVGPQHKALSFLPMSHSFERMIVYLYLFAGISIYFAESIDKLKENLLEVKPNVFSVVPRLLEKVYAGFVAKGEAAGGMKTKIFKWAVQLGLRWEPDHANGAWYHFQLNIADKLVFKKLREALGGNVISCASGSAALQPRLARLFNAAGIPVREGYGLTETSPVISVGGFGPGEFKVGTVGPCVKWGTVQIAEDGEILYKGPNVMLGYYKRQDLTDEAIDKEGWFHTGDIGVVDESGFIRITDRKKEIFKTSGGKYIAPQVLENKFKECPFIEQIVVIGENQKFPAAIIMPNLDYCQNWMKENEVSFTPGDRAGVFKNEKLIARIAEDINKMNEPFGNWERIKQFRLVPDEWTPLSGIVTPTLKIKRKVINEKYKAFIEDIYKE